MQKICQSCSMPMDNPSVMGTEKDGSKNGDYCKFCYSNGTFTNPGLTLDGMIEHMKAKMKDQQLPPAVVTEALTRLPLLKRWKDQQIKNRIQ